MTLVVSSFSRRSPCAWFEHSTRLVDQQTNIKEECPQGWRPFSTPFARPTFQNTVSAVMMMSTAASIFTITVLFTLFFVTNVESVPHKGSRSLAVAADGARTLTNGERFARGLPPNKPIRRRSRMFAVLCWLMVFDFGSNKQLPYMLVQASCQPQARQSQHLPRCLSWSRLLLRTLVLSLV